MCGGLAHRSGHLGSRQGVLRRGDPICQRLTRHLLSEGMSLDSQASNMVLPPFKKQLHAFFNPGCPSKKRGKEKRTCYVDFCG